MDNKAAMFGALVQALEEMQAGLFTAQAAHGRAQAAAEQLGIELGLGEAEAGALEPIHRSARGTDITALLERRFGPEQPVTFSDE